MVQYPSRNEANRFHKRPRLGPSSSIFWDRARLRPGCCVPEHAPYLPCVNERARRNGAAHSEYAVVPFAFGHSHMACHIQAAEWLAPSGRH